MNSTQSESDHDLIQMMRDEAAEIFADHSCSSRAHLLLEAAQKLSDSLDLIDNLERGHLGACVDLAGATRARDGLANALQNTKSELNDVRLNVNQLVAALDSAITLAQSAPAELATETGRQDYANQLQMLIDTAKQLGVRTA